MKTKINIALLSFIFLIWGFMTVLNDILIPFLKKEFYLNNAESMTVNLSFFGSYFLGSLLFFQLGTIKKDPISKWGYKKTIAFGLFLSSIGTFLFLPAVWMHTFSMYLVALFVLGFGFTLLQISCNPYINLIGKPGKGSERLNLAQGFNSLGTTLSPLIGGYLIFSYLEGDERILIPYIVFTVILLILSIVIFKSGFKDPEPTKVELNTGAIKIKQVRWAMWAIFFYVGAEVTIGSKMVELLQSSGMGQWSELEAKSFLGIYWGGALIGRFMASAQSLSGSFWRRNLLIITIGVLLFVFVLGLQILDGQLSLMVVLPFMAFIGIHFILSFIGKFITEKQVALFAGINLILVAFVAFNSGGWLTYLIVGIGFFNSILWSHLFSMGIANLKDQTGAASSLLVMMIVGGAIIPMIHGFLIDFLNSNRVENAIKISYLIAIPSYFYISYFGIIYPKIRYNHGK